MYHNIKPLIPPQHLTSHSPIIMRFVKTNRKRTDLLKLASIEIEMHYVFYQEDMNHKGP